VTQRPDGASWLANARRRWGLELNDALSKVNPGDILQLKDGMYTGVATITRAGTVGSPITLPQIHQTTAITSIF
jgi:hypothetical protein